MSALSPSDSLLHGPCVAAAKAAAERYRTVLGVLLIVDAGAGLALLFSPHSLTRLLLGEAAGPTAFVRLGGLFLLILTALLLAARAWPVRAKIANAVGIIGRGAAGLLLIAAGGRLVPIGAIEALAAVLLGILYFRTFTTEVMSRP